MGPALRALPSTARSSSVQAHDQARGAGGPGPAAPGATTVRGALYTWRQTWTRTRSITILPLYVKAFFYSSGESRRDDLSLFFDREGILRGMGLRRETEEDED